MATCKGRKKDGTPCKSPIVLDNGYCHAHQDQASEAETLKEPVRWTRERLEAAIAAHGGPEGLPLGGADLSNLDLSMMNLDGITLTYLYEDETIVLVRGANLQGADLQSASLQGANLFDANLQGADLSRADLQGASLFDANLQRADLRSADLREVDLLDVATGGLLVHLHKIDLNIG